MIKITSNVSLYDAKPSQGDMLDDVLTGLSQRQKQLSPKYFYDERGSTLFDQICELPEYYIPTVEMQLLKRCLTDLPSFIKSPFSLFEMGSGSSHKIRILLDDLQPRTYVPIDISKEHLIKAASTLAQDYPWIDIQAACVDYSDAWSLPLQLGAHQRMAFFPGSSLGNFDPNDAKVLLQEIGHLVGSGGLLLIGIDLVKDRQILEAAYNDTKGVTAAFNMNILKHINHKLNANFDLNKFSHQAFYNDALHRIEMHLLSRRAQTINVAGHEFEFSEGESIHTENSYKYSIESFQQLHRQAGFNSLRYWTDDAGLFSIHLLQYSAATS